MKAKFYLMFLAVLSAYCASSQVIRPFTPRYYNASVRGNIVYVSNSIISSAGIGSGSPGTGELPPSGSSKDNSTNGINIDIDGDASTFNSSSSNLSLLSCSQILFAGLYWGADQGTSGTNESWITAGYTSVKIKLPGSTTYQTITSQQTDRHSATQSPGLPHTGYLCFADITSLINSGNHNGTYTVADVVGPIGIKNACGGWTLVIAYSNVSLLPRNLTVFDGSAIINGGDPAVDVSISGFLTPPSGPVSCELGAVVFDGDRASSDSFSFKQSGASSFYPLASTTVPLNGNQDAWNSKISYKGSVVTTRSPAFNNTLGYDASIFDLPNTSNAQLSNNQTGATVRFKSPSENYFVQVLTTSVSQYNPSFAIEKSSTDLNGSSLAPGDILRYQVAYNNVGNDSSSATFVYDNIPAGSSFLPGSLKMGGVAKTDAAGDDEAEYDLVNNRVVFRIGRNANASSGGIVTINGTGNVTFDVVVASSCNVLSCVGAISNRAALQYVGIASSQSLIDSSGVNVSGCIQPQPVTQSVTGACYVPVDTILVNTCPVTTVTLPATKYAGYRFYSAMPFVTANLFNPATVISSTHTYWAYFSNGAGCSDTIQINVYIISCPDIDDDNDGIPDYVELNNPVSLQDADSDGIPNWKDTDYPGYVDHNSDGFNDNFDPGADSDNDGVVNFLDPQFAGYSDSNGDGVNDAMDKDLDGIPNNLDLDSDNDGIPDVVESFGVDANGDGRIDNYSDTDNDGFSQNVDANNTGVAASANGLGAVDTDGDGIPNYLDLDSDNDGVPDVKEAYGADANNDGTIDNYIDLDGDGYSDSIDGDVGNDGAAENSSAALLRTGTDANNDGRADSYPYNNMDADSKPNPYDLDSDGDGISDVKEAGHADAGNDGRADGAVNANGWNAAIASSGVSNLPNTDGSGRSDLYDIDADDDGIPDNIEAQLTTNYFLPTGIDTDGDGIDNAYDNSASFGGSGIAPVDTDVEGIPDYMDTDTDSDGYTDLNEGNDLNGNGILDDNIALSGIDTDGDGLDDFFDNNNLSAEGTSRYMGNGGSISGDLTPGSITTVQRNGASGCSTERDWRCMQYVLSLTDRPRPPTSQRDRLVNSVQIAPNPAREKLQVIIKAVRPGAASLQLFDATGKKLAVFSEKINAGTNTLIYADVKSWPNGIYYLQVNTDTTIQTYKFQFIK